MRGITDFYTQRFVRQACCFLLIVIGAGSATAQQGSRTSVTARFEPGIVVVNQTAELTIRITREQRSTRAFSLRDDLRANFQLPSIPGLEITHQVPRTETQTNIIAGQVFVSQSEVHTYLVRSDEPGIFSLPSFDIQAGNQTYRTNGTSLEVIAESASDGGDPLMLELVMPQDEVYVGETVKATVQIWVSEGIPQAQPLRMEKIGTAFSESAKAQQYIRGRGQRSGTTYNTLSLPITLTPIKGGLQSIQYQTDIQMALADPRARPLSGVFGSFGLSPMFNRKLVEQRIVSELREIPVKPLPLQGRPDSFTGAIGEFGMKAIPSSNQTMVGEPIRLTIDIIGHGNFDRIQSLNLDLGDSWRTLAPESGFRGGDGLGYSGRKRFVYSLIPVSETIAAIPEIAFTFFDTELKSYRTLTTQEIPISVSPNPNAEDLDSYFDQLAQTDTNEEEVNPRIATRLGGLSGGPVPLATLQAFQWGNGLFLLAITLGCGALAIRRKLEGDVQRKRLIETRAALEEQRKEAEAAMIAQNSVPFLQASAGQVRRAMGLSFGKSVLAWTAEEIVAQLDAGSEIEETLVKETRAFFIEIEGHLYQTDASSETLVFSDWSARSDNLVRQWMLQGERK